MKENLNHHSILNTLASHQHQLNDFGVKEIGLFGSYISNNQQKESDIDLLVDLQPEMKTFKNYMKLVYYLEDLFGRKVDLVTKQSLSPYIGPHILKTVQYATLSN